MVEALDDVLEQRDARAPSHAWAADRHATPYRKCDDETGSCQGAAAWGEAHAVHMKSRILGEVPAIGSWFEVNMPTGGGKETMRAGGFDVDDLEGSFAQNHGAGYRAIYDLGAPENSVFVISIGPQPSRC